jgi:hypothetical protein
MSTESFSFDSFLSDVAISESDNPGFVSVGTDGVKLPLYEQGYEGKIDYRIRQLSHSGLETFVTCPRKYQLNRYKTTNKLGESEESGITFAFGHVFGDGVQKVLEGKTETQVILAMFLGWHADLLAEDTRRAKSFWLAVTAVRKFMQMKATGFLDEYELVYHNGKPACELSFCINFPDGFRYRGFVDVVLRHKDSGRIVVLELKTKGTDSVNPAAYKNSRQAIGYSIVLDFLFPDLSSYEVLYLVYTTKDLNFTCIPFTKTYLQRALWIRELLLDIETIKMYEEAEVYPMRGNNCLAFFRECEYINSCTLSTEYLKAPATEKQFDTTEYTVNVSLMDLLESQFAKTEG